MASASPLHREGHRFDSYIVHFIQTFEWFIYQFQERGTTMSKRKGNRTPSVKVDGRRVTLADFPIIAFSLTCGHVGRERAIRVGDHVFCDTCADTKRVANIVSQ